jgi:hypothetical protein
VPHLVQERDLDLGGELFLVVGIDERGGFAA